MVSTFTILNLGSFKNDPSAVNQLNIMLEKNMLSFSRVSDDLYTIFRLFVENA